MVHLNCSTSISRLIEMLSGLAESPVAFGLVGHDPSAGRRSEAADLAQGHRVPESSLLMFVFI